MPSEYLVEVDVTRDGERWAARSAQMPKMNIHSSAPDALVAGVIRRVNEDYAGKVGELRISMPLGAPEKEDGEEPDGF